MKRQRRWLAGMVAIGLVLAGCGGGGDAGTGAAAGEPDRNGTLRFAWTVPAQPLDPHTPVSSVAQSPYVFPIYDRLTQLVAGPELEPMLATEWSFSPDGQQVTFTLRDDVTFHDGTELDANAVKTSLDRARTLERSTVTGKLSMVENVEILDPHTVRIDTNRPASDLPYVLAGAAGAIINPAAIDRPDLDSKPAGSGPYRLVDLKLGDRAVYERSTGYWDPEAQKAERLEIVGITDDNARLSALRSGEVDGMLSKIGQHDQAAQLGDGFALHSYPPAATYALQLNTQRPHIDQVKVRQALNYAIDREALNEAILDGQCTPQAQPLTSAFEGHLETPPVEYTYDPERARQLLAEAGLPNGFDLSLLVGAGLSPQDKMAPVLQAQLGEVGVRVSIESFDLVQVNDLWKPGSEYDAYLNTRVAGPTAGITLRDNYLLPSRYPGPTPPGFQEAVSRSFETVLSDEERVATLRQASEIAVNDAMDLFLCALPTQVAYSDRMIGAESMGHADFQGVFDLRYAGIAAD